MQRERIREQLGYFEEQLERLDSLAISNENFSIDDTARYQFDESILIEEMKRSFHDLATLVQEETLRQKSLPAHEFLNRIIRCLVQQAAEYGYNITVTQFGEGRVSLEMVELSMSAILSCISASMRSYKGMSRAHRMKHKLYVPYSIYLEVRATLDEIHFRLIDDGQGYSGSLRAQFDSEKHFKGIRSEIGKNGGWFKRKSFENYGGAIEFKMPLKRARFDSWLLRCADGDVLVPVHCISEVSEGKKLPIHENEDVYARLSAETGLSPCSEEEARASAAVVRMGVADFQVWVVCDSAAKKLQARRCAADGFLSPDAWFTQFGIFHERGDGKTLPLLDGDVLLRFHGRSGT